MHDESFSLSENAFNIVGATYTSTNAEVSELVEDRISEARVPEATLHKAQRILLTPRLRITAELSWLPELSFSQTEKVLNELRINSAVASRDIEKYPELARANILADFCRRNVANRSIAHQLIAAWDSLDERELLDFLRSERRKAGQPAPDREMFTETLSHIQGLHASMLAESLLRHKDAASEFDSIFDDELSSGEPSKLVSLIVRAVEKLTEPKQKQIADAIKGYIEECANDTDRITSSVNAIIAQLKQWSVQQRLLSRYYRWRGHPPPASKTMFFLVRDFSLDLANNRDRLSEARLLTKSLEIAFGDIDDLKEMAETDLRAISEIIESREQQQRFQPLYDACEIAKRNPLKFAEVVKRHGLTQSAPGVAGAFVTALSNFVAQGGDAEEAASVCRHLALHFNNDASDPRSAYNIVEFGRAFLASQLSVATVERLNEDGETIYQNWKLGELEAKKGDLAGMIQLLEQAIVKSPPGAKPDLNQLLEALKLKRKDKRVKLITYAAVALVVGGPILYSAIEKANKPHRPSSTYERPAYPQTAPSAPSAPKSQPNSRPVNLAQETMPPIQPGQTLSRDQIRYCIFQGHRLEVLRNYADTNFKIDRFNFMINSFNDRCGDYRYRQTDMSAVQAEASSKSSDFQKEAAAIARGW